MQPAGVTPDKAERLRQIVTEEPGSDRRRLLEITRSG